MPNHTEDIFYLIDQDGHRRVPCKMQARDGRHGYAVHPKGKGNDSSAAEYVEDVKRMVQAVVLYGKGVRARACGGPKDGQVSTLGLNGRAIRGYWLAAEHLEWVAGGTPPEASVRMLTPVNVAPERAVNREIASDMDVAKPSTLGRIFQTKETIRFSDHCCQGRSGKLTAGPFTLNDLTMTVEGPRRLRFAPLGNRPEHPRLALVGITPGGQIERFASNLSEVGVVTAARKAAFSGAQGAIKELLGAHGFADRVGISLECDLNESPDVLTTSIVKCCLMVDDGYRFGAPDILASAAATHCATVRFVKELRSYPTLAWVVVFGEPGWYALNELLIDGKPIVNILRDSGLRVLQMPHFAQNFQQRALFKLNEDQAHELVSVKAEYAKYSVSATNMRNAIVEAVASI